MGIGDVTLPRSPVIKAMQEAVDELASKETLKAGMAQNRGAALSREAIAEQYDFRLGVHEVHLGG